MVISYPFRLQYFHTTGWLRQRQPTVKKPVPLISDSFLPEHGDKADKNPGVQAQNTTGVTCKIFTDPTTKF